MEKLFASYEIAKKLKKLGFEEPCFGYYSSLANNQLCLFFVKNVTDYKNSNTHTLAPTYCQVIDWVFDKLSSNEEYYEVVYSGSKPRTEIEQEIQKALNLIENGLTKSEQ